MIDSLHSNYNTDLNCNIDKLDDYSARFDKTTKGHFAVMQECMDKINYEF